MIIGNFPVPAAPASSRLCLVGRQLAGWHEVLQRLGRLAESEGFARPGFTEALVAREQEHPTGLPTPVAVAIPHAEPHLVVRPALGLARLDPPVAFGEMGAPAGQQVAARAAILLLVTDPGHQVPLLSRLVDVLQRPGWFDGIATAEEPEDLAAHLNGLLGDP